MNLIWVANRFLTRIPHPSADKMSSFLLVNSSVTYVEQFLRLKGDPNFAAATGDLSVIVQAVGGYRHDPYNNFTRRSVVKMVAQRVEQAAGHQVTMSYDGVKQLTPVLREDTTHPEGECVRLIVGQVPYSMTVALLSTLIRELIGVEVLGLRPNYRKHTSSKQVTGAWFVDVRAEDVAALEGLHKRVLLRPGCATMHFTAESLEAWVEARAAALAHHAKLFEGEKARRPLGPMSVEKQKVPEPKRSVA